LKQNNINLKELTNYLFIHIKGKDQSTAMQSRLVWLMVFDATTKSLDFWIVICIKQTNEIYYVVKNNFTRLQFPLRNIVECGVKHHKPNQTGLHSSALIFSHSFA
jgi:hypothetical protein